MQIRVNKNRLKVSPKLIAILQHHLASHLEVSECGIAVTFKDPEYSPENGGFHPVEMGLDPTGKLLYITDFAYVGTQPYVELAKEIDFDFQNDVFEHFGRVYPLHNATQLYALWEQNFMAYYDMNVYRVTITGY